MKKEKLEVVRGSDNVFRELGTRTLGRWRVQGHPAAEIIKAIDRDHLTVRAAHKRTGIRCCRLSPASAMRTLGRFTVDRLMSIINRLGSRVEVKIRGALRQK